MSVVVVIPPGARVRKPQKRFYANFFIGDYDFNQTWNTDQLVMTLDINSVYLIERRAFSANMTEGVWLGGLKTEDEFPKYILQKKYKKGQSIYAEPTRCLNYEDNSEEVSYFKTDQKDDELLISFIGVQKQTAAMNFVNPLITQVSFTIYQINQADWKDWYSEIFTGLFEK